MGGAINRSFISAHFLLSAYFLTVQTYKRLRLITRVYGICIVWILLKAFRLVDMVLFAGHNDWRLGSFLTKTHQWFLTRLEIA